MAIAAGSGLQGAFGAAEQARAQREFNRQQAQLEKHQALLEMRQAIEDINQRQIADQEAAAAEVQANARQARAAIAEAQVVASEAGAGGANYAALIHEFEMEANTFSSAVARNLELKNQRHALDRQNVIIGRDTRFMNAELVPPVPEPDYVGFGLKAVGEFFSLHNSITSARQRSQRSTRRRTATRGARTAGAGT